MAAPARRSRLVGCLLVALAAGAALQSLLPDSFVPAPGRTSSSPGYHAVAASAAVTALPQDALAKGGQWGPLEGKASSLVHPFVMAILFLTTVYTGYLGWQWRSLRAVGADLTALKKKMPESTEGELSPAVKSLQAEIEELSAQRKELQEGKFKNRHQEISSLLLGGGIFFTVYGVFNTWFRAEKLFPGPHLFAGAAICVIWALAAACVPWMEKGNETARTLHIGLNVICVLLFGWQLVTGFEIFLKVIGLNIPWF